MKVYLSYMAAAYKGLLIPLIILAQSLFQLLQIASNWWMAWANPQTKGDHPKTSNMVLIGVYMALAFGSSWFIFVRAVLVATFGLAAAQKLFLKMLTNVFRAPMSFFDSTPAGQILNRVSIDQSVVDLDIPFRLGGFAATTIQLIGIVGVMTQVTWQIVLLVIPMAIACLWMQISKEHGGIMRLILLSCFGAYSSSPSRMLRAKAAAVEAILRELPEKAAMVHLKALT